MGLVYNGVIVDESISSFELTLPTFTGTAMVEVLKDGFWRHGRTGSTLSVWEGSVLGHPGSKLEITSQNRKITDITGTNILLYGLPFSIRGMPYSMHQYTEVEPFSMQLLLVLHKMPSREPSHGAQGLPVEDADNTIEGHRAQADNVQTERRSRHARQSRISKTISASITFAVIFLVSNHIERHHQQIVELLEQAVGFMFGK